MPAEPPNTTPHAASVGAPHSSPFTKFAQRPKNSPIGAAMQPTSARVRYGIFVTCAATMPDSNAPISPPWKLMPPWLNAKTSAGCAK